MVALHRRERSLEGFTCIFLFQTSRREEADATALNIPAIAISQQGIAPKPSVRYMGKIEFAAV